MARIKIYSDVTSNTIFFDGARTVSSKILGEVEAVAHPTESNRIIVKSTTLFKQGSDTLFRVFFKRLKISRIENEAGEQLTAAPYFYDRDQVLSYLNEQFTKPKVIEYFEYNATKDRLVAKKDVEVAKNGFFLGDKHKMASGNSNIYFEDLDTKTNAYPIFGEVLDQSIPANQVAGAGFNKPKSRIFGDFQSIPLGGSPVNDTAIPYDGSNFFPFNISGVGITTRAAEVVAPTQQLKYEITVNGISVYVQYLDHTGFAVNDDITWYFDQPLDIETGTTLVATIYKISTVNNQEQNDGVLLVCEGDATPTRYQTNVLNRFFEDEDIALKSDVDVLLSGSTYKGAYSDVTSLPSLPTGSDVLGDFYRVSAGGSNYAAGDILVFNGTDYDHIAEASITQNDLLTSAIKAYDIYVKAGYTGAVSDGSLLYPYGDIESALVDANDGDSIYLDGIFNITTEIVLPSDKSLFFYGNDTTVVQYSSYSASNGDVFSFVGDGTKELKFKSIDFKNAGGYGLYLKKTIKTTIDDCTFKNNGWNGTALNTVLPEATTTLLGYDSDQADLQAFYAGANASNGGAMRIEEATQLLIVGNTVTNNLRGIRVSDCGVGGAGVISRNQSTQNIESGIYLSVGALGGCQNVTVMMNVSAYNANNGLLVIGGINNKFSQNEVNGNWNAGFCAWGSANATLRDCGLYDNNRSQYNGIGNTGDAKASIQINDAYNLLGTNITLNPAFRFIAEILDTQVHYTGLGSNTEKIGFLITSAVGALADNPKNIIKVDDVGFIGQDYAIDLSEVDVTNLRLSLGDNSYQSIGQKAVKAPLAGNYSELPFSNHVMQVPEVDVVVDTLKQTIALHEGVSGNVINVYKVNELQSVLKANSIDIIQKSSDKIQLRDLTLGNVYINGVVAGSNLNTMNDSLNAAFNMDLTEYKEFIETEVGVVGDENSAAFYYIESPDGTYHYPLFKTEAEANQVDIQLSGSGASHTHTYADDLTNTTWYMPNVSNHMDSNVMPLNGLYTAPNGETIESVVWNIQTTDDDANYVPTFNSITYNVQEGSAINIPYKAAGMTDTFNITNIPAGYADNGFAIIGTAEDITNGAGNSVQHVINVTKANTFGSVQGTITVNVLANLAGNEFTIVEESNGIKFTQDAGSSILDFNTVTFNAGSTYKFYLDHSSVESNDTLMIVDADGNAYTTGVTLNGTVGDSGAYLEFIIPADVPPVNLVWTDGDGAATITVPMTLAGSTYTETITGITKEGPSANQTGTNVMDQYDHGWISLDETLGAGERLILDNAFFADFLAEVGDTNNIFAIGLKGDNWTNTKEVNNATAASSGEFFKGNTYIVGVWSSGGTQVSMTLISNGVQGNSMLMNSTSLFGTACAFLEITSDGNNIRSGFGRNSSTGNITAGDESTVTYSNWNAYKGETGEQGYGISNLDVVMSFWTYNGGDIDGDEIDWTGLTEISIPTPSSPSSTNFNKAIDLSSGTNEYVYMNDSDSRWPLLKLPSGTFAAHSSNPLKTSDASGAEPFMTSCVFQPGATAPPVAGTGGTRGGRIWGCGQGISIGHFNIMLEQHANNDIIFSWGKVGNYNGSVSEENNLRIIENADPNKWYGVYIAHRGHRSSAPSAADLGAMFDIYVMSSDDSFAALGSNVSTAAEWGQSWNQIGKSITDSIALSSTLHFGGVYHSNSAFSGKIASFVCHPLHGNADMPDAAEVKKSIVDPIGWANDLVGTSQKNYVGSGHTFAFSSYTAALSTQIYLFGDGANDSFSGGIRNQVHPGDTSYTDLSFVNMVANDIENVTINGLS